MTIAILIAAAGIVFLIIKVSAKGGNESPRLDNQNNEPREAMATLTKQTTITADNVLEQTFRFVAIDVETANADTSSICQLGLALVTDGGQIQTLSFLINPEMKFADFNVELHGIDKRMVKGHPNFPEVIEALRDFLNRHSLIQHSQFDKRAINGACKRYGLPTLFAEWHDSVKIAQHAWPELKGNGGHGLANLKSALDLDFQHHDAAEDAKAAAQIVLMAEVKCGQDFRGISAPKNKSKSATKPFEKSPTAEGDETGPLFGHVACFTGKLSFSRAEATTVAASAGISVKAGVSKKVTLLVVGDQDLTLTKGEAKSTKHRKADELIAQGHEIRILGETEFLTIINAN
jgi:DNA polymerase-3 subunit epsilon